MAPLRPVSGGNGNEKEFFSFDKERRLLWWHLWGRRRRKKNKTRLNSAYKKECFRDKRRRNGNGREYSLRICSLAGGGEEREGILHLVPRSFTREEIGDEQTNNYKNNDLPGTTDLNLLYCNYFTLRGVSE